MKPLDPQPLLMPCPFCAAPAMCYAWQDEDLWSHNMVEWQKVRCTNCECEGNSSCPGYAEEETAVATWNSRPPMYAFMYNDCVYESSPAIMSLHATKRGAWKAMHAHHYASEQERRDTFLRYGGKDDSKYDAQTKTWNVREYEVQP